MIFSGRLCSCGAVSCDLERISWSLAPRLSSSSVCVNLSGAPVRSLDKQIMEKAVSSSSTLFLISRTSVNWGMNKDELFETLSQCLFSYLQLVVGACSATSMSRKYDSHFKDSFIINILINNIIVIVKYWRWMGHIGGAYCLVWIETA